MNLKKKGKSMIASYLNHENLIKRLDLVFDECNKKGIVPTNKEISDYVEFNKQYLVKLDEFIENLFEDGFIYICQPDKFNSEINFSDELRPMKAEIITTQINNFCFLKVDVLNYGFGDPNKIFDLFELDLITNEGKVYQYELTSSELLRFKFQGSLYVNNGQILAQDVPKALDALNKYYG